MRQLYQLEVYAYLILTNNSWVTLYSNKEQALGMKGKKHLTKLFEENLNEVKHLMEKNYSDEKEKHYCITLTTLKVDERSGLLINDKTLKGIKK